MSEYPSDHPAYSTVNKKVERKIKDEMRGYPIKEFVSLRRKMYSVPSPSCWRAMVREKNRKSHKQVRHTKNAAQTVFLSPFW